MRKALFYGNCQLLVLHDLLKDTLLTAGVEPVHVQEVHLLKGVDQVAVRAHAQDVDVLIAQHILVSPARPGSDELSETARTRIVVPNTYFSGYHQHLQVVNAPHGRDTGCLATWALVRQGHSPQTVQDILLREDAFTEADVFALASAGLGELERREAEHAIDIPVSGYIRERWRSQMLFHTVNHPARSLLLHVANRIIDLLKARGLLPSSTPGLDDSPSFDRAFASIDFLQHLILPGVAKALGLTEGIATPAARMTHRERFKLPHESSLGAITLADLAKEHQRWCTIGGWDAGMLANDRAAAALPTVRTT